MITLENIQDAHKMIDEMIVKTPLVHSRTLSRMFEADIFFQAGKPSENRPF